ncbi:BolA family protein [Blastochloris sulfoviridis]|uniref:BolA family transcriptional regulator n=1 Tax=Blastochloris sulfoviridis TaxID=50712 RepID=A0A5M6I619_9HYPH|nr:BolA family protein [Blastochloris sulfoviridis]KAA5603275.1 BolA family transcriptional regulator [Blastochloris sulfoviridis]
MTFAERIESKLRAALAPSELRVDDDSDRHAGHAGSRTEGETHFRIYIVAEAFRGKSRVARHRMVNDALRDEFAERIHALAIHAAAPGE